MQHNIDKTWSLFLDRDGVINTELPADYVKNWTEFEWRTNTLQALKILKTLFGQILVVTNQRGVGLGKMDIIALNTIHKNMTNEIEKMGGRIDKIYYSTDTDKANSTTRKPAIGMGMQAQLDFPAIDFKKSIMVGNSMSDMQFGRNLGMINVFIDDKLKLNGVKGIDMDYIFDDLGQMASFFNNKHV
jgi:D-glycero-D-manno-heptose 1,7-bisphosphate phosphatase